MNPLNLQEIMRKRAEKLGFEKLYMWVKDKLSISKAILVI